MVNKEKIQQTTEEKIINNIFKMFDSTRASNVECLTSTLSVLSTILAGMFLQAKDAGQFDEEEKDDLLISICKELKENVDHIIEQEEGSNDD